MCGIAGFISRRLSQPQLHHITRVLQHRGPDAEGFFSVSSNDYHIGLGHRRLSIIDLSEAANQPMTCHSGRFIMIFNGEVYNYNELRNERVPGKLWRSSSDSEVILECFAEYGPACFSWLNGIFALAIWDILENKLTLARDHLGIKPLFYFYDGDEFIFASELKAIRTVRNDLSINKNIIPAFLHLGYIPHPFTIYEKLLKLNAGSYSEIKVTSTGTSVKETIFWSIRDKINSNVISDEQVAKKSLDDLLTDTLEKQLISDVPIGTFLSGGTDSSVVTALAAKVAAQKINTYSIAVLDGKVNEAPYAAAVAAHLGTNHHELPITQKEILDMVPDFMKVYDEPFTDSSAFPTMMVSKLARQHVTVTLSGDGGDELFWGYGSYLWTKRMQNPILKMASPLVHATSKLMSSRYKRAGLIFSSYPRGHFHSHLFSQDQYLFSENELKVLLTHPEFDLSFVNYSFKGRELNAVEQMSFWDIENYLKDDLLVKVDRASMKYSLETRVPLLDYRVVEFALNLSPSLKIHSDGTMKYLLKQVLYDYVPKSLLERPKWGFSIPLARWLKADLKWLVEKYCAKQTIEEAGIVRYEEVAKLLKRYESGKFDYLYNRIWTLIVLHWFLDEQQ